MLALERKLSQVTRFQASEKIWASVVNALKATAKSRGWQHDSDFLLRQVSEQLGEETGRPVTFDKHMAMAEGMRRNMCQDWDGWDKIERHHQDAQEFIRLIDHARASKRKPYRIRNEDGQHRIGHLLGLSMPSHAERSKAMLDRLLPVGTFSEVGFSPAAGYKIPR